MQEPIFPFEFTADEIELLMHALNNLLDDNPDRTDLQELLDKVSEPIEALGVKQLRELEK